MAFVCLPSTKFGVALLVFPDRNCRTQKAAQQKIYHAVVTAQTTSDKRLSTVWCVSYSVGDDGLCLAARGWTNANIAQKCGVCVRCVCPLCPPAVPFVVSMKKTLKKNGRWRKSRTCLTFFEKVTSQKTAGTKYLSGRAASCSYHLPLALSVIEMCWENGLFGLLGPLWALLALVSEWEVVSRGVKTRFAIVPVAFVSDMDCLIVRHRTD